MILLCFFASGAAALVYELVWLRMLALLFGHTVHAATAVLTAVMAGLALGSALMGPVADRPANRIALYGWLEIGIGVWCGLIPWLVPVVGRGWVALHAAFGGSRETVSAVQFVLAFLLLLPATTLMGATVPLLGREVAGSAAAAGRRVGALYAVNTAGAVTGTVSAGYVLLEVLGTAGTVRVAAALNVLVGIAAIAWGRGRPRSAPAPTAVDRLEAHRGATPVLIALALSGAAAMVYEVAWARVLALVIGSSTYAFTAMLVAFLAGLAAGSAVGARLEPAARGPGSLAAILAAVAVSAPAMIPTFDRFPDIVARAFTLSSEPGVIVGAQVVVSVLLMAGPTLLLGAAFPFAVGLLVGDAGAIGQAVGRLYAFNTLGAIVGAAGAGLLLVPGLGAQGAVKAGGVLELVAAGAVLLPALRSWPWRRRLSVAALGALAVVGIVIVPGWNRSVMASGVAIYGPAYARLADRIPLEELTRPQRLLFFEEGATATVSVHEGRYRFLRANGKTEASNGPDMHTQLVLGHLPLLLHPAPRRVLVIGLASGMTAGAVARHPIDRIDVVEIEPAMVRAAQFFRRENGDVLADRRVALTVADARTVLLTRSERWDVIISEPSNPWVGGVATLFTSEFYALAAQRLAPDGLMVQWMQGYAMTPDDLRMVARTFRSTFPATTIWGTAPGDYLLVGAAVPAPFPHGRIAGRYAANRAIREDLARVGISMAPALVADFMLGEADTVRYAEGARISTDDRLSLEFSAARSLYRDTIAENWLEMRRFRTAELAPVPDTAETRHAIALAYAVKNLPGEALAQVDRALERDPQHVPALLGRGRLLRGRGNTAGALGALEAARAREPGRAEIHFEIGATRQMRDGPGSALADYRRAVELAPGRPDYLRAYATALAQSGRVAEALSYLVLARAFRPGDPALMDLTAFIYLQTGDTRRALELLQQAVRAAPGEAIYHFRLGQAQMQAREPAAAIASLERAAALRPDFVEAHLELANTYMVQDRVEPAIRSYQRVLALDPNNTMAMRILSTLVP